MIALLSALAIATTQPGCSHIYDREAELARDVVAFDQTEGQGWRPLYDAECYIEAAELLRDWRAIHADSFDLSDRRQQSLYRIIVWHEAQMWAFGGRNDIAFPHFEATYQVGEDVSAVSWNLYVDGTLAFLRRDRPALEQAIAELAAVPAPPGWGNAVDQNGNPISMPWPQNLDVLQGLEQCWDEGYAVAYLCRDIPSAS